MTFKISVPLHITGFFSPHFSENPLFCGSTGAGLVITPGIKCVCKFLDKKGEVEIFYNTVKQNIKPIKNLLKLANFNKGAVIKITSPVPLGFGYGVSGAATLAISLTLHHFWSKPNLDPIRNFKDSTRWDITSESKISNGVKAARMAHIAEVESLTGLGDVLAIFSGRDLAVRVKPGAPGIGKVKSFKQAENLRIITAGLKKISTEKMLKSMNPAVFRFGSELLKKFIKNSNLENFFKYSQLFAEKAGFADENFFKNLEPLKKYCIGFTIKKGVLFAAVKQSQAKNAVSILKKFSPAIHIFKFGGGINDK